ncbi:hypothetical protein K7432_002067 [Basidiobolus ranarum]|uniref:Uncharacterized protein n=1 Tax=Basidiobolus ranarum TaxID=34480 RepID=A0ABR2W8U5_9FUNG
MSVPVVAIEIPREMQTEYPYISPGVESPYRRLTKCGSVHSTHSNSSFLTINSYSCEIKTVTWESLLSDIESSINNLERNGYVRQVRKVVFSIRQTLLASDTLHWGSEALQHRDLSNQLHKVVGEVNWLVVICKLAESIWPPSDIIVKLRSQSKLLLDSIGYFSILAKQHQISLQPVPIGDGGGSIYQQSNYSSESIFRKEISLQGASYSEEEFINQLDLFAEFIISKVSKVAKSANRLSLDAHCAGELVDQICQTVDAIGQLLSLIESMNVPIPDDPILSDISPKVLELHSSFLEKKANMYNDANQLVTRARSLLLDFVRENANAPMTVHVMRVLVSSEELVMSTKCLLSEKEFVARISLLDDERSESELEMLKRRATSLKNLKEEEQFDSDWDEEATEGGHPVRLGKTGDFDGSAVGRNSTRSSSFSSTSSVWSTHTNDEPHPGKEEVSKYFQCSSVEDLGRYPGPRRRAPSEEGPKPTYLQSGVGRDNRMFRLGNFSAQTIHVCESPTSTEPSSSLPMRPMTEIAQQKPRKQSVFDFRKPPGPSNQAPATISSKLSFSLGFNTTRRPSLPATLTTGLFSSNSNEKPQKQRMGFFRKRSFFDLSGKKDLASEHSESKENHEVRDWYLGYDYSSEEIVFNNEGQLIGGTIQVLVERLTLHDTSIDSDFVNVFLLTFRNFCYPNIFCQLLMARFNLSPPQALTSTQYRIWNERKLTPIRLRVHNILKTWLESYFYEDEDYQCLGPILNLAQNEMKTIMPLPAERLVKLIKEKMELTKKIEKLPVNTGSLRLKNSKSVGRLIAAAAAQVPDSPPPMTLLMKSTLDMLSAGQNIPLVDIDPTEIARQLTIMENGLFCSIRPHELIGQEFSKKEDSLSFNVRQMSKMSTKTTEWVVYSIIQEENIRHRLDLLRYFIRLAEKCCDLNNFQSLMAIMCGLNLSMVSRLKRTWSLLPSKYEALVDRLRHITDHNRNYYEYRKQIKQAALPCLPFMGVYLTDLTFMDDGNPSFRRTDLQVINFSKHVKTVRIIQEIQRFQVPYNLAPVPSLQSYLTQQIDLSSGWNPEELYEISLKREPRKEVLLVCQQNRANSN